MAKRYSLPLNPIKTLHFLKPTLLAFLLSIAALPSHAHNISHFQKAKTDTLQPAKAKTLNTNPNITITFDKTEQTQYGYDAYKEPLLKSKYEAVTDNTTKTTIYPAWKALESGKPDVVKTTITASNGYKADSVYFENENGNKITKTADALTLIGGTDGSDIRIYATYPDKDGGKHVAQLNTASYDKVENKVYLIPLNGTTIDAQQIQTILNAAYKQAVASFTVEVKPNFVLPAEIGSIEVGNSSLLSTYTDDMQKIIKAYKAANNDYDKDNYYLFVGGTPSDASQLGYMPRAKNFGFIFSTDLSDKTIAHELGHGAFHLKHTFDETSVPKSSSQNLMDYATGTFLNKYQWDYVHNPAFVIGLFESDKAGAMLGLDDYAAFNLKIYEMIFKLKKAYKSNTKLSKDEYLMFNTQSTVFYKISLKLENKKFDDIILSNRCSNWSSTLHKDYVDIQSYGNLEELTGTNIYLTNKFILGVDDGLFFHFKTAQQRDDFKAFLAEEPKGLIVFASGYRVPIADIVGFAKTVQVFAGNNLSCYLGTNDEAKKAIEIWQTLRKYASLSQATPSNKVLKYEPFDYWGGIDMGFLDRIGTNQAAYIDGSFPDYTAKSTEGFNTRKTNGEQAGINLDKMIKAGEYQFNEATDLIDVVSHSMGFAYSLGLISKLQSLGYTIGRVYAIAPENPTAGIRPQNVDEFWHYGSNETDDCGKQDYIAPQGAVQGEDATKRVFIPNDIVNKFTFPFLDCHTITNYDWILKRRAESDNGYVKKRY